MTHPTTFNLVNRDRLSKRTVVGVEHRQAPNGQWHFWELVHYTPGYRLAGAGLRYHEQESWSVTYYDARTNTTHGQAFKSLPEAEVYLSGRGELAREATK